MPTTPAGLPYPAASDEPNVPQDLQNLAEALDASVEDTGWVDVSFVSGYTSFPGATYQVQVRRVGKVVQMVGLVQNNAGTAFSYAAGNTHMFTLPAGFRPSQNIFTDTTGSNFTTTAGRILVTPAGTVSFAAKSSPNTSVYWSCHLSWMVD